MLFMQRFLKPPSRQHSKSTRRDPHPELDIPGPSYQTLEHTLLQLIAKATQRSYCLIPALLKTALLTAAAVFFIKAVSFLIFPLSTRRCIGRMIWS